MTDFTLFPLRRGGGTMPRKDGRGFLRLAFHACVARVTSMIQHRQARRALRLALRYMSDTDLRDIGLKRCAFNGRISAEEGSENAIFVASPRAPASGSRSPGTGS